MPEYVYRSAPNPYVGSIGDAMLRRGDIAAQRAAAIADAESRAAIASGNAWGHAAESFGHIAGGVVTALTDPRRQAQQLEVQRVQEQRAGEQQLDQLVKPVTPSGPAEGGGHLPSEHPFLDDQGLYDIPKLTQALSAAGHAHLAPELLKGAELTNDAILKHQALQQKTDEAKAIVNGDMAHGVVTLMDKGVPFDKAFDLTASPGFAATGATPQQYVQLKQQLAALPPDQQRAALTRLMDQAARLGGGKTLGKDAQELDRYGRVIASNMVNEPGKGDYTINGQRFKADGTPIGAAVPKQVEPAKVGSPEDFIQTYAQEKFHKPAAQLTVDEKSQALSAFKEANADQDLRTAALAQKNLAAVLTQLQISQTPTPEQAASVADDLVNHRISPEQLASLFSTRGKEGLAFKLAVTSEAKKQDPSFNFEEASATYNLVKSAGFQNTVRYMDSVQESMPRLLEAATKLGRGNFRTWNDVQNAAASQFNSVDLKKLKVDALLVGDEVAKILSGGGTGSATSDAKLKQATELISASDSVPALAGALGEIDALIGFRRRAMTRGTYMEGTSAVKPAGSALDSAKKKLGL